MHIENFTMLIGMLENSLCDHHNAVMAAHPCEVPKKHFEKMRSLPPPDAVQGFGISQQAFCKNDRPFSSSTWSGRLFFCSEKFQVSIPKQTEQAVPFSLFTKIFLAFSYKPPKVSYFQKFLLTWLDFCGNLFQQFNITYLLRVPARLPKEPEQVFNFLIAT